MRPMDTKATQHSLATWDVIASIFEAGTFLETVAETALPAADRDSVHGVLTLRAQDRFGGDVTVKIHSLSRDRRIFRAQ